MASKIKVDPLFLGLTRSPMILGVSYSFFGVNALIVMAYFITTSDFKILIFALFFHVFGVVLTKKEPLAIEILINRIQKCNGGSNRSFYKGLHSYNMF